MRIARLVADAQAGKASVQRFADRVARAFIPVVLFIAVTSGLGWFIMTDSFETGLLRAVTVLVVACPCTLGLATPLAISAAVTRAARMGILIHRPDTLERAGHIRHLVFDKTGTLTKARLAVDEIHPADDSSADRALGDAAALERYSSHPIARAIVAAAGDSPLPACSDVDQTPCGIDGIVNGRRLFIGSASYLAAHDIAIEDHMLAWSRMRQEHGNTILFCADEVRVLTVFSLADELRGNAKDAVSQLRRRGVTVTVLSGDNERTVRAIGEQLGLDDLCFEVSPDSKLELVRELKKRGFVGMVGDGSNDAPALSEADLGIAMGGGTDIAAESADATLLSQDLTGIVELLQLSQKTMRVIQQNFAWALLYNAVTVTAAVTGFLTPFIAASIMASSSLIVVANSLRVHRAWRSPVE